MKVPCDFATNCSWPVCDLSCEGRKNKSFSIEPKQSNVYADEVWNAAIEACVGRLNKEFIAPEVVIEIIKKEMKK